MPTFLKSAGFWKIVGGLVAMLAAGFAGTQIDQTVLIP